MIIEYQKPTHPTHSQRKRINPEKVISRITNDFILCRMGLIGWLGNHLSPKRGHWGHTQRKTCKTCLSMGTGSAFERIKRKNIARALSNRNPNTTQILQATVKHERNKLFSSLLFSSLVFSSLLFSSLSFPSLPFPSLPLPSLPFPSLSLPSLPFPFLPFPSLPFRSVPFRSVLFPSFLHFPLFFHCFLPF